MNGDLVVGVDGPDGLGSGYVIAPGLVLTSAHVVPAVGGAVTFFRPGKSGQYAATVVWRGTPGGRDDAALLRFDDGHPDMEGAPRPVASVRWGRLVTHRPETCCEIRGLPAVVQREHQGVELLHTQGTVNRADRSVNNRYLVRLEERVVPCTGPSGRAVSPWAGLSGAAMFCDGLLTGVICADFDGFAHTRLEAAPAYVLLGDDDFRRALAEHGVGTVLEPAEWAGLSGLSPRTGKRLAVRTLPASPAALLEAQHAVVPFRGREELLRELRLWCEEPGLDVRLVHGPGGQGKSRLALELTARLESDRSTVVWLKNDAKAEDMAALGDAAVPLLVILDYAETRVEQLTALLTTIVARPLPTPSKVLLLARTADDWWQPARRANSDTRDLLDDMIETPLPPLEPHPESRAEAYRVAVEHLARALPHVRGQEHHTWPKVAAAVAEAVRRRPDRLDGPGLDIALVLHMTALADLLDEAVSTAPNRPGAVTDPAAGTRPVAGAPPVAVAGRKAVRVEQRLLDHESKYWAAAARQHPLTELDEETRKDALAAAFLCGADTPSQAEALLGRLSYLTDHGRARHRALAGWIAALYPPHDGRAWGSLRPDRLAEYFVGERLTSNHDLPQDLLGGMTADDREPYDLTDAQIAQLLTVYARAAAHPAHRDALDEHLTELCVRRRDVLTQPAVDVATQVERPQPLVSALDQLADEPGATPEDLLELADRLPRPTHALGPLAAKVTGQLVEIHRRRADEDAARLPGFALMLRRLTGRLGDVGRTREAYEATGEAVGLYRRLAQEDPATYRPHLAAVLHNLSLTARVLGKREEALAPAREAVEIYGELRLARPDADEFRSGLAHGLGALAQAEGELGRPGAALAAMDEEVGIRRDLAAERGDLALPELAAALNNRAIWLMECGRVEEALSVSGEAVARYRSLAERRADAFRNGVARSLGTYSTCLHLAGRPKSALEAAEEAVGIRRRLAAERPGAYLADLALSVHSLTIDLAETGRTDEALARAAEAVGLYRRLAEQEPAGFGHRLANSLNTYAHRLNEAGRPADALEAAREAVGLHRPLFTAEPGTFRADLAMSLDTLATQLEETGHPQDALRAGEESVGLYRALAGQRPDAPLDDLACALTNLSHRLNTLGRPDEALAALDEVVRIRRRPVTADPLGTSRSALAGAQLARMHCLCDMGRMQDAVAAAAEAVELYRGLVQENKENNEIMGDKEGADGYARGFAAALSGLWLMRSRAGQAAEALTTLEESIEVSGRLMGVEREQDAGSAPANGDELFVLGTQLSAAGRPDDAARVMRRAVTALRRPSGDGSSEPSPRLLPALSCLTTYLIEGGRRAEALPVAEEATGLLGDLARRDAARQGQLAHSLWLLGCLQHNAGRGEAEETLRRAVIVADALPPTDGRDTVRGLARSGLGMHLVEGGRAAEGLAHAREAVGIARDLAGADPAHGRMLALVLTDLGRLLALGTSAREEAFGVSAEALAVSERVATTAAPAGEPVLVWALAHHGLRLSEAGRHPQALDTTARAVSLSRGLAARHRAAHEDHLAFALYAYARTRLLADARQEEARDAITEAAPLWQALAETEPGLAAPYLAAVTDTHARLAGPG
ncbi:tetratricopeptide repeat protein [Streptomyces sp. SCA3-4]|uniref:tetratricopeptide repeat protein n=1 Tax=Streptomyces sichuanensis TaxID=2871810 RepID=UPI001CE37E87|nr:tetratricopeptide repeat protein [Streptomyces sichuanensis]MCA6093800.1 tetratricopeptide repeat protein [Streptomyces sichuanensis]